jgi:Fibronectin type III domain
MKFSQKAKYFSYGVVAVAVLVPLALKAVDTIPLTFKKGDVISATVLNNLFSRINDVTSGFTSVNQLDGAWSCTTYSTSSGGCTSVGNLLYSKTGIMTFTASSKTFTYTGTGDPRGCFVGAYQTSGNYDVQSGFLVTDYGVYDARKNGPNSFLWTLTNSLPPSGYTVCSKQNSVPAPPTTLSIAYSGTTVTLTWTDANADNTGYIVQRSTDSGTTWTTINTITSAATLIYTDSGLTTGTTYQYQVVATNANGNSIGSSVVQAAL